ncbi:hypothetical protein MIDIC_310041 [Alphaproteobacteria bacterium]
MLPERDYLGDGRSSTWKKMGCSTWGLCRCISGMTKDLVQS